ncbi:MAG: hypothetical protein ACJAYG_001684 [Oceanicoccus sp.]|jgi:hypothetical protein
MTSNEISTDHQPLATSSTDASKTDLLDELQSIKGLFGDHCNDADEPASSESQSTPQAIGIPVLSDVVEDHYELLPLGEQFQARPSQPSIPFQNKRHSSNDLRTTSASNDGQPLVAKTKPAIDDEEYEEEQEDMFPELAAFNHNEDSAEDIDMELLIQDIVDELVPSIEDKLHRQLCASSNATILQLADKLKQQ